MGFNQEPKDSLRQILKELFILACILLTIFAFTRLFC